MVPSSSQATNTTTSSSQPTTTNCPPATTNRSNATTYTGSSHATTLPLNASNTSSRQANPITSFMLLNIQGMTPSATSESRWKLPYFIEKHLLESNFIIPIIAITESWLKPYITDAQVSLPKYNIIRSDRINRERGGTVLYIQEDFPACNIKSFDNDYCEVSICTIQSSKSIVACVYRPPDTDSKLFDEAIKFMHNYISDQAGSEHYEVIIMGDFNLPALDWNTISVGQQQQDSDMSTRLMSESNRSAHILLHWVTI